jgi:hypothetical protein
MTEPDRPPLMIGWKEYVDFVDWGIRHVKIKIDTGARTSALGAHGFELKRTDDGTLIAELRLQLNRKRPEVISTVYAPVLEVIDVRNTGGSLEPRLLIETTLRLGPIVKRVRLTVANRSRMLFPMILGRKALEGDFLVDVGRKYMLRKRNV